MQNSTLPETFRPLLWSYDFSRIDPLKHKKTIILQALNYGTLAHCAGSYKVTAVKECAMC
jgi:uncharacterized protein DUF6922